MIKWTLRNAIAVTALIVGLGLAAPEAAQVSAEAAKAFTFTPKRIIASGAVVTGLIGAVIGALALTRFVGSGGKALHGTTGALVLGTIAVVMGGIVVAGPMAVSAPAMGWLVGSSQ